MTKKKPEKVLPKRSTRKKFDLPIDPEVEAWSKKLFHPVKPIIEGMKGQKSDSDISSPSDLLSDDDEASPKTLSRPFLQPDELDPDILSATDIESGYEFASGQDNLSASQVERDRGLSPRSGDRKIVRSGNDRVSDPEIETVETGIGSEIDTLSEPDIKTGTMRVPFVRGELRLPNYLFKGLLSTLSATEFVVYLWLYFLSYGFGKSSCYVSAGKIADAVNLTERTVFRMLNSLEARGLIRRASRHFLGKAGGLTFDVFLPQAENGSDPDLRSVEARSVSDNLASNKDHDHDPKRRTDHERRTIALYQDLTNNSWTPADDLQYVQIRDLPIETIELNMRLIAARAAEPVRSFAYFAKSLRSLGAQPSRTMRSERARLQEIMREVRQLHTGGRLTAADLEMAVRARCETLGIAFDKALFNDLLLRR